MYNKLKSFQKDQSGVVAVVFALVLPILIGFAALGIESGNWLLMETQMQRAADTAAYSGIVGAQSSDYENETIPSSRVYALGSGMKSTDGFTSIFQDGRHTVTITRNVERQLSAIYSKQPVIINTRAVAAVIDISDASLCLVGLSEQSPSVTFKGRSRADLPGCTVWSNTNQNNGVEITGNATVNAGCVGSPGDIDISDNSGVDLDCDKPRKQNTFADPYADVPFPDFYNLYRSEVLMIDGNKRECGKGKKSQCSDDSLMTGFYRNTPIGYFPDGLTLSGTVNLPDGIYVTNDLTITQRSNITGRNVMIYLVDDADLDLQANISLDLKARNQGDFKDILIASKESDNKYVINNVDGVLEGSVYFPNSDLKFTGNLNLRNNSCAQFIANTIELAGNAEIQADCNRDLPELNTSSLRLVE